MLSRSINVRSVGQQRNSQQWHYQQQKPNIWGFSVQLLQQILGPSLVVPLCAIWSDNQAALNISRDDKHYPRTKHIDIQYHFVRDLVKDNKITIKWVPTHEQSADIFTKGLGKTKFRTFRKDIMDYAT